jgi:hypothetical protein
MGEITKLPVPILDVVINHFWGLIGPTHYFGEVKLNYLHIYVHSHRQKEYLVNSGILFIMEEYAECILI